MNFLSELTQLINKYSLENTCNTPDFILASYLKNCLENFIKATRDRESWYGNELKIGNEKINPPQADRSE